MAIPTNFVRTYVKYHLNQNPSSPPVPSFRLTLGQLLEASRVYAIEEKRKIRQYQKQENLEIIHESI